MRSSPTRPCPRSPARRTARSTWPAAWAPACCSASCWRCCSTGWTPGSAAAATSPSGWACRAAGAARQAPSTRPAAADHRLSRELGRLRNVLLTHRARARHRATAASCWSAAPPPGRRPASSRATSPPRTRGPAQQVVVVTTKPDSPLADVLGGVPRYGAGRRPAPRRERAQGADAGAGRVAARVLLPGKLDADAGLPVAGDARGAHVELAARFDHVLVETGSPTARGRGPGAGQPRRRRDLVVAERRTRSGEIAAALRQFEQVDAPVLGAVSPAHPEPGAVGRPGRAAPASARAAGPANHRVVVASGAADSAPALPSDPPAAAAQGVREAVLVTGGRKRGRESTSDEPGPGDDGASPAHMTTRPASADGRGWPAGWLGGGLVAARPAPAAARPNSPRRPGRRRRRSRPARRRAERTAARGADRPRRSPAGPRSRSRSGSAAAAPRRPAWTPRTSCTRSTRSAVRSGCCRVYQSRDAARVGPVTEVRPADVKTLAVLDRSWRTGRPAELRRPVQRVRPARRLRSQRGDLFPDGLHVPRPRCTRRFPPAADAPAGCSTTAAPGPAGQAGITAARQLTVTAPGHAAQVWTYDAASLLWRATSAGCRWRSRRSWC